MGSSGQASPSLTMVGRKDRPVLKLKNMGETVAQHLPQEHVRADRGGQEPYSDAQPELQVWRSGNTHWPRYRAQHYQEEVTESPDGGNPYMVSVQDQEL